MSRASCLIAVIVGCVYSRCSLKFLMNLVDEVGVAEVKSGGLAAEEGSISAGALPAFILPNPNTLLLLLLNSLDVCSCCCATILMLSRTILLVSFWEASSLSVGLVDSRMLSIFYYHFFRLSELDYFNVLYW